MLEFEFLTLIYDAAEMSRVYVLTSTHQCKWAVALMYHERYLIPAINMRFFAHIEQ